VVFLLVSPYTQEKVA
jgi:hypothetical protein